MSLYQIQKLLYDLNRTASLQERFRADGQAVLQDRALTEEERDAFARADLGLLYVLGAHPSLLIHFAGIVGVPLVEHRRHLIDGLERYGPVREGILAPPG